jgi:hypothetical protein
MSPFVQEAASRSGDRRRDRPGSAPPPPEHYRQADDHNAHRGPIAQVGDGREEGEDRTAFGWYPVRDGCVGPLKGTALGGEPGDGTEEKQESAREQQPGHQSPWVMGFLGHRWTLRLLQRATSANPFGRVRLGGSRTVEPGVGAGGPARARLARAVRCVHSVPSPTCRAPARVVAVPGAPMTFRSSGTMP